MKKKTKKINKTLYWLMKSEPDVFSIEDLVKSPNQTACWVGIRNYQARNYMRDDMQLEDRVLVYHSNAKPSCVVGTATVVKTSHPDHSAWNPGSPYFDPKTDQSNPRWFMVDIRWDSTFTNPQSLEMLREYPKLANMVLLKKGMRLSIQTVTQQEFAVIEKLGSSI